jgi:hypothetical protein
MSRVSNLAFVAVVVLVAVGEAAAARFTAELEIVAATNQFGQYVTASYDFGIGLTNIQELRLELDVPGGYEGTARSTGNSSWSQWLLVNVQGSTIPIPSADVSNSLGRGQMNLEPGSAVDVRFSPPMLYNGFELVHGPWPDFLAAGSGKVWFTDLSIHSYHPPA